MNEIIWCAVGLVVGSILGIFVMGLMAMSKHSDLEMEKIVLKERLLDEYKRGYNQCLKDFKIKNEYGEKSL